MLLPMEHFKLFGDLILQYNSSIGSEATREDMVASGFADAINEVYQLIRPVVVQIFPDFPEHLNDMTKDQANLLKQNLIFERGGKTLNTLDLTAFGESAKGFLSQKDRWLGRVEDSKGKLLEIVERQLYHYIDRMITFDPRERSKDCAILVAALSDKHVKIPDKITRSLEKLNESIEAQLQEPDVRVRAPALRLAAKNTNDIFKDLATLYSKHTGIDNDGVNKLVIQARRDASIRTQDYMKLKESLPDVLHLSEKLVALYGTAFGESTKEFQNLKNQFRAAERQFSRDTRTLDELKEVRNICRDIRATIIESLRKDPILLPVVTVLDTALAKPLTRNALDELFQRTTAQLVQARADAVGSTMVQASSDQEARPTGLSPSSLLLESQIQQAVRPTGVAVGGVQQGVAVVPSKELDRQVKEKAEESLHPKPRPSRLGGVQPDGGVQRQDFMTMAEEAKGQQQLVSDVKRHIETRFHLRAGSCTGIELREGHYNITFGGEGRIISARSFKEQLQAQHGQGAVTPIPFGLSIPKELFKDLAPQGVDLLRLDAAIAATQGQKR